jgi:hypothetical protein
MYVWFCLLPTETFDHLRTGAELSTQLFFKDILIDVREKETVASSNSGFSSNTVLLI